VIAMTTVRVDWTWHNRYRGMFHKIVKIRKKNMSRLKLLVL